MSQENVELASRVMEAIGRQDADELARLADADVEWHSLFALGQVYRGHDGTRQYLSDLAFRDPATALKAVGLAT